MGLEIPDLDDRDYETLLEDATKRIPVHTDEWTDHNVHDPGITILELLAWIVESDIYQANRLGERHVQKYLKLMGVRPEPPRPASTRLWIDPPPALDGTTVQSGEKLVADDGSEDPKTFQTTSSITLTTARIETVLTEHRGGRVDNTNANRTGGIYFHPFGERAQQGSALYLGFDGDPFGAADHLEIAVDFHEDDLPRPASHGVEEPTFEPTVEVVWEHCTDYDTWFRDDSWSEVEVPADGTEQFYRGGTVTLEKPAEWIDEPARVMDLDRELRWLRCRVEKSGYEIPPQVNSFYLDVVPAEHLAVVEGTAPLRRPDGGSETSARPGQTFAFEHAPVLRAEIRVGGTEWEEVDDFDASGPDDEHYVLDPERGEIRFGDNLGGAVPEAGRVVEAEEYAYGGGKEGNVSGSADWRFQRAPLADAGVTPLDRVSGGTDAESIGAALTRLKRDSKTPYRAVAPSDYRYVATHTPGLRFGRATTVIEREDAVGDCEPHSTVRVVVVPFSTLDRPEPSRGFLDAVERHLQKHRLVTDRIEVEPPTYVGIGVETEISILSGYSESGRTSAVESALDEFLHPLRGFDGDGWPFGRPVYRSEVYETIEGVEGVDCVHSLSLSARGASTTAEDGTVEIADGTDGGRVGLVYPESHEVVVAPDGKRCGGT